MQDHTSDFARALLAGEILIPDLIEQHGKPALQLPDWPNLLVHPHTKLWHGVPEAFQLQHLISDVYELLTQTTFELLTQKTLFLLALATAAKMSEIHALDFDLTTNPRYYGNPREIRNLCEATRKGDLENVKQLLAKGQADINCKGVRGLTPVMCAAWRGHSKLVKFLVSRGAYTSLVTDSGNTILHLASDGGNLEMVKFLLSRKSVDIEARNKSGMTATEVASANGHQELRDFLQSFSG
ncbi:histone-lysine N-methyltransferase EHMT2-like [Haliotis rubra]|uniref:histone-lysine N-methyltransferase EHMT2-like n=1 Tax=Haliotis rubra TaxID=36100 RepID=UPI001EE5EC01|nr:histone-lysine N-methyltransferase EHMT2-like [Haliotis rubra]